MPNVYPSGNILPETRGKVSGGLAVVLHDPADVDGLIALCATSPRPPEDPMAGVYRALGDPSLDIVAWAAYWRDLETMNTPAPVTQPLGSPITAATESAESFPISQVGKLRMALKVVKELWLAQHVETSLLSLVVLLAEPGQVGQGELILDGEGAALVVRPGSLLGEVVNLPLNVTSFAVCLVVGGGTTTSARRPDMIDRLRANATQASSLPLEDIRKMQRPLGGNRPLVVLVHGLFATDVGTFGALQHRLEQHFAVVGFPHDTLSESIGANGRELAKLLADTCYTNIFCVAHSRGGLVARSAALHLAKDTNNDKRIDRCVTFGTPHLGAAMAENAGALIATIAFLKASLLDRSIAGVADMLCCRAELKGFPGISDLRPASTKDTWLAKFQDEEGLRLDAKMPLFAVGGQRRPAGLMQHMAGFAVSRVIGRQSNDLVVAQSSSLPMLSHSDSQHHHVDSDHFSYFKENQSETLDKVIGFLTSAP